MVHTAAGYAKAMNRRATLACSSSIGPGATNMITGAALATINRLPVLLLPSDYYATRRQGPVLQQLEHVISFDESVNDCFRPVSKFFDRISPARAAHRIAARGDAGPDRPGRDGRGHDRAASGRAVRGRAVAGEPVRAACVGARAPPAPPRPRARRRRDAAGVLEADDHRRRGRPLLRGVGRAGRVRRDVRHPGGRDRGRQGLLPGRCRPAAGRRRRHRVTGGSGAGARRRPRDLYRYPPDRLPDWIALAIREPRCEVPGDQRVWARCPQDGRDVGAGRRARGAPGSLERGPRRRPERRRFVRRRGPRGAQRLAQEAGGRGVRGRR